MTRRVPDPNLRLVQPPPAAHEEIDMAMKRYNETLQAAAPFAHGAMADYVHLPCGVRIGAWTGDIVRGPANAGAAAGDAAAGA